MSKSRIDTSKKWIIDEEGSTEAIPDCPQIYLKMSRKQLENFLEQERRLKLGASITRFAIDADASDEERAAIKREEVIEKIQRNNRRREAKRRLSKLKLESEHGVAHIDELLKFESGSKVKMTAKIGKARKKEANSERNAKQTEARKWEKSGKITMARWIRSGISKRDDRKENPDRDKDAS
jgi:hypothetical protein